MLAAWFPANAATPVGSKSAILVVGDSLSAAYGLQPEQSWVALLQQRLAKLHPNYHAVNASISGDTTAGGLARLPALLKQHKPAVVIIALGGNDGLRGLSPKSMASNLSAMVKLVQHHHAKALVVGVRIPPNYGPAFSRQFEAVFPQVATETGVPLVRNILTGFDHDLNMMQADGVHPLAAGQPYMLNTVWRELIPLLRTTGSRPSSRGN